MGVPILTLNVDDNLKVVVKQDTQPVIVTGATYYSFTSSGATQIVENQSGNLVDVTIYTPVVDTSIFVDATTFNEYTGTTAPSQFLPSNALDNYWNSGQTQTAINAATSGLTSIDLFNEYTGTTAPNQFLPSDALNNYWNSGQTQNAINAATSGLTSIDLFNQYTGNTDSIIDGMNESITNLNLNKVDISLFTGHTSDLNIHFTQAQINITESQVQNLVGKYMTSGDTNTAIDNALLSYWNSGETQIAIDAATSGLTYTFEGSGSTTVYDNGSKHIVIYSTPPTGTTVTWIDILSKPSWLSGQTLSDFEQAHTHSQYLTGVTWGDVTDKPNLTLQSDFTGLTNTVSNHTGDTSIHYVMSAITITESQISDLQNYALQSELSGYTTTGDFNAHTGNSAIHYPQSGITINIGQVTDLSSSLANKTNQSDFTGLTQTVSTHTGDTSIHFTQAEISITESQISDLQNYALESSLVNYLPLTGGTVTGKVYGTSLDLSGDLKVDGTMNIVHVEEIYSEKDFIFTRSGNTQSLGVGQISGIGILNANGLGTTVVLGADKDGIMRVGWSGDTLVALAGREDNPTNGYFAKWDSATSKYIGHDLASDLNAKANVTDFNIHTGDTAIHYPMSAITITESQISDLKNYALNSTVTGLTQTVSNHTGDTSIHFTQAEISITESQISDLKNYALQSGLTGLTQTVNNHTGDASIHFKMNEITGFTSSNDFSTFTDTTLPENYYNKTEVNGLISGFTTPYTFVESGATQITQVGQTITIYSPTGGTASAAWTDITDKPAWITGATVTAAELNVLDGIPATLTATELGYSDGVTSSIQTQLDGKKALNSTIVSLSTNTTIDATYAGKIIECTGTFTLTLPNSMSTGMIVDIVNVSTGVITIAASTTLQTKNSYTKIATQYGGISAYHRGSNIWIAVGDLSA